MKAILILDMPSCCSDCQLYDSENKQCYAEPYNDIFLNNFDEVEDKINPNCRLKPLPLYQMYAIAQYIDGTKKELRSKEYIEGFNDCIDEMLGEENESTR